MPPYLYPGGYVHHHADENRENRKGKAAGVGLRKAGKEDHGQQTTPEQPLRDKQVRGQPFARGPPGGQTVVDHGLASRAGRVGG